MFCQRVILMAVIVMFFVGKAAQAQNFPAASNAPNNQAIFPLLEQTPADAAFAKGVTAYKTGDYGGAIIAFTEALGTRPFSHPDAFFNRGVAYKAQKNWAEAERDFTTCCNINPNKLDSYLERGRARRVLGRLKNALVDFSHIIDQNPHRRRQFAAMPPTQRGLFADALIQRAATQYQLSSSGGISEKSRVAAYDLVLADYDAALTDFYLSSQSEPVALFNRAFIAEMQAADMSASPAISDANARYEAAAAGYTVYLESVPKSPDAPAVKQHILQINTWLRGDKSDARPTPSASLILKEVW